MIRFKIVETIMIEFEFREQLGSITSRYYVTVRYYVTALRHGRRQSPPPRYFSIYLFMDLWRYKVVFVVTSSWFVIRKSCFSSILLKGLLKS